MKVELINPKNNVLKNYIYCYYVLERDEKEKVESFFVFPSPYNVVSIYRNCVVKMRNKRVKIKENTTDSVSSTLLTTFKDPIHVIYKGRIKVITIGFKPLGLNAFIKNSLDHYNCDVLNPFNPYSDYLDEMKKIMDKKGTHEMVENLDNYWLSKFIGFEHPFLNRSVEDISNNLDITVVEIAKKYNVSHKTFIKHFRKHLNRSPSEFKRILRFRKLIESNRVKNNTNISTYYDQAHMIKDFKGITGFTPKKVLENLNDNERYNFDKLKWFGI